MRCESSRRNEAENRAEQKFRIGTADPREKILIRGLHWTRIYKKTFEPKVHWRSSHWMRTQRCGEGWHKGSASRPMNLEPDPEPEPRKEAWTLRTSEGLHINNFSNVIQDYPFGEYQSAMHPKQWTKCEESRNVNLDRYVRDSLAFTTCQKGSSLRCSRWPWRS